MEFDEDSGVDGSDWLRYLGLLNGSVTLVGLASAIV